MGFVHRRRGRVLLALAVCGVFLAGAASAAEFTFANWHIDSPDGFDLAVDPIYGSDPDDNPDFFPGTSTFGIFLLASFDWDTWNGTNFNSVQWHFQDVTPEGSADPPSRIFIRFELENTSTQPWDGFRIQVRDGNGTPKAIPGSIPDGDSLLHPQAAHFHVNLIDTFEENLRFTNIKFVLPTPYTEGDFDEDRGIYDAVLNEGSAIQPGVTWTWGHLDIHAKIKEDNQGNNNTAFSLEMTPLVPEPPALALVLAAAAGLRRVARPRS